LKLAISYVALSILPLVIFYVTVMAYIESHYLDEREEEMLQSAVVIVNNITRRGFENIAGLTDTPIDISPAMEDFSNDWDMRILVFNEGATVIVDTNIVAMVSVREGQTLIIPEVLYALEGNEIFRLRRETQMLYFAVPVPYADGERFGAVLLVSSAEEIFSSLAEIRSRIFRYSMIAGLAMIVLIIVISNQLIAPVRRMLKVVQKMALGQLNQRVPIKGGNEYAIWGKAFNSMSEKLEQVEKTREEFVSNVSHELKTPLSSMKVLSEAILLQEKLPEEVYREFLRDVVSEVDRMTNINNDLLALVKIDQREQGLNIQLTSINKLVEDILKRLTPLAEQLEIELQYENVRPVQIDADEIKLSLAISNIIENGIKYTPKGGTVKVVVDADHQFVFITVQDTGIGIPEDELDRIFNRFYRVDKTRDRETGGTGLGLSISYSTVVLHGGSIRVNSKLDEGSVFIVRIPIRRS